VLLEAMKFRPFGVVIFFRKSSKKYATQTLGSRAFEKVCIAEVLSLLQVLTNFIFGTLHNYKTKSCGHNITKAIREGCCFHRWEPSEVTNGNTFP